jgi:hypothetical protein
MNADAEVDAALGGQAGIALDHAVLNLIAQGMAATMRMQNSAKMKAGRFTLRGSFPRAYTAHTTPPVAISETSDVAEWLASHSGRYSVRGFLGITLGLSVSAISLLVMSKFIQQRTRNNGEI